MIRHQGAGISNFFYDDLILPKVTLDSAATNQSMNHTFDVPVLRPSLDCTVVPRKDISAQSWEKEIPTGTTDSKTTLGGSSVNVTTTLPPGCVGTNATGQLASEYSTGGQLDWVGVYREIPGLRAETPLAKCPSVGIIFGHRPSERSLDAEDITVLVCSQGVDELRADVTYQRDSLLGILSKDPPLHLVPNTKTYKELYGANNRPQIPAQRRENRPEGPGKFFTHRK
ncbi:hypothetical protein PG996_012034 [Apiospora saccharicola]|uniref:Uncharacterized protein n=1 Tax=Apiospora saccharicola TaxID=335842 RepID=A0ABR1U1P5_9PEZI